MPSPSPSLAGVPPGLGRPGATGRVATGRGRLYGPPPLTGLNGLNGPQRPATPQGAPGRSPGRALRVRLSADQPLRAFTSVVSCGSTANRSPTTP
ncbi:hypothetical protein GCM10010505_72440 [Kitasatospora aburaviensis]